MRKLKLEELNRLSPNEFEKAQKLPISIVLDDIRSGMNVGAFFRTADCFGLEKLYLCGITPTPLHKEINKTAIGADRTMPWEYAEEIYTCIEKLKKDDYLVLGVEQTTKSLILSDYSLPSTRAKVALVFGNEVNGLNKDILSLLDDCIEIKQFGTKHSLNVSVCGGVLMWELARQLRDML